MHCGIDESTETFYSADIVRDPGDFECNICFELAQDPIVTQCGHLYCWPCLFQWLQLHSHSHDCPVCKAIVEENKLIPIYGRGKTNCNHKSPSMAAVQIPNRPTGQRPQTAPPRVDTNYVPSNDLDPLIDFMPMAAARFGHMTLSTIFATLPAIFNLQVHGFHDNSVYGATSGVPFSFSSSIHGGYAHGFRYHHSAQVEWKPFVLKTVLVILISLVVSHLIFA